MDKKTVIILGLSMVIIILAVIVGLVFLRGEEDTWLCQNGEWVKHGNPVSPMPITGCGNTAIANPASAFCLKQGGNSTIKTNPNGGEYGVCFFSDGSACEEWSYFRNECQPGKNISVFYPFAGGEVNLPFKVEGIARVFESVVSFRLKDGNGDVLFSSTAMAQSPDLGQFGAFTKEINYLTKTPTSTDVVLEVYQASAKDGSDTDKISVPLKLNLGDTTKLKIYFNNTKLDPAMTCNKVFPVDRVVAKTETPAKAALELLLAGELTQDEAQAGYETNINPGVKLQKVTIVSGTAKADFDEQLEYQVGGSCRVAAISAQIIQTLKQFSTVKKVIISINGRTEDILQP
ncbi:MAG: DUF333 domain-containing protein [Patescibacteria group bacterium]